jgi:hypothetical protein
MIAVSQRTVDVVYSKTNLTITSYSNLSDATAEIISPSDLLVAFDTIFGPDYTSTGNLTESSSAVGSLLYNYINVFTDGDPKNQDVLGELVALPILMFQPTSGFNPNSDDDLNQPQVGLAPDLYFSVDLSESKFVAVIPKWVVIVYLVVSIVVYSCCVGVMFLSFRVDRPPVSSFELIDFASRVVPVIGKSISPHF